jgi:two-component sensor histidine kinase
LLVSSGPLVYTVPGTMISFINKGVTKLHDKFLEGNIHLSRAKKALIMAGTVAVYAAVFVLFEDTLKVSINFFVLIPMFVAASLYQFWGGFISGALALPVNLFILWLLGNLSYSPASKVTAFVFGIGTGAVLGVLSGFYIRLREEIEEHRKARETRDKALEQKQLLLHESHHRIKNNLTIIMGIIELEILEEKDERQEEFLHTLIDRISSVSITQNLLYSIEDISEIEMHAFISKLIDQITLSAAIQKQGIEFVLEVDKIVLDIDKALPIGLIINETCTNSIKYAFRGTENPCIHIKLSARNGGCILSISDNGQGLPKKVLHSGSDSVGLNLIQRLAEQMNADFQLKNDNGAVFEIKFLKKNS